MNDISTADAMQYLENGIGLSAERYSGRPLSVATCDRNGDLMSFARVNGAKLLTVELTQRKARTSARMGCTTRALGERVVRENLDLAWFGDDHFTALPGGVPLVNAEGVVLGSVAVGGLSATEDHECAELLSVSIAL